MPVYEKIGDKKIGDSTSFSYFPGADVVEDVLERRLPLERPIPTLAEMLDRDPQVEVFYRRQPFEEGPADRPEFRGRLDVTFPSRRRGIST
jgi:hypothetical protein